jgi:outer membrane biosynthesis protein TonB
LAIEDLDLVFEEEEIEKSDAIDVDVDLDFSAHVKKNANGTPVAQAPKPAPVAQAPKAVPSNVKNISEAQKARPVAQAKPQTQQVQAPAPVAKPKPVDDSYADELDMLRDEIAELRSQVSKVQNAADVKVAVAEAKTQFLVDYITDAKLMDHQVNQMLSRIHKKVPALKNEVLTIKKYISEFISKTKK